MGIFGYEMKELSKTAARKTGARAPPRSTPNRPKYTS